MVAVNRARSKVKRLDLHGAYWLNRFTVFKVSDPHGGAPHGLFARNGALYGATGAGGVHDCYTYHQIGPCGLIFRFQRGPVHGMASSNARPETSTP